MLDDDQTEDMRFAANVRREREKRGWSQTEMARRLQEWGLVQFHPTTVSRVENGERPVRLSEASRYADIFDTSVEALLRVYTQEVEDFVESLSTMRELRSRVMNSYDMYDSGRGTLAGHLHELDAWIASNPEIMENAGNKRLIEDLRDTATALIGETAHDVVAVHEAFLKEVADRMQSNDQ